MNGSRWMGSLSAKVNRRVTGRLALKPARSRLKAPLVSITFDDFPRSAWTVGGAMLARRSLRATYYVAGWLSGEIKDGLEYFRDEDLAAIAAAGHEIGCHTFSHDPGPTIGSRLLLDDIERNAAYIHDRLGDYALTSFAYPYGEASPRTKLLLGRRFPTSRGIRRGINTGMIDLSQLKSVGVEKSWWTPAIVEQAVDRARRENGWLIFFTHDVSDAPTPYGCTPAMLDHLFNVVEDAKIEVLPVKHALARTVFG